MIVEDRYTFFQIENKLRQICQEGMEALRSKITKEADIIRKVQVMAEGVKRDISAMEPRIDKALSFGPRVDKAIADINNLESNMRIEGETTKNHLEMFETTINVLESKVQTYSQTFHAEMQSVVDVKKTVKIALDQIQTYKEEHSKWTSETIDGYKREVDVLKLP